MTICYCIYHSVSTVELLHLYFFLLAVHLITVNLHHELVLPFGNFFLLADAVGAGVYVVRFLYQVVCRIGHLLPVLSTVIFFFHFYLFPSKCTAMTNISHRLTTLVRKLIRFLAL